MRQRRYKRNREGLRSSPFVVLTDLTVGLAFFFALLSILSNANALVVARREAKQARVREQIVGAFTKSLGSHSKVIKVDDVQKYTRIFDPTSNSDQAQIRENGNLQRISLSLQCFESSRSSTLTPLAERVLKQVATVLKENTQAFSYLFVHGITEPGEVSGLPKPSDVALEVSRHRADRVYQLMIDAGLVSKSASTSKRNQVPRQFAIAYGTGFELYTATAVNTRPGKSSAITGRVDLVVFYTDSDTEAGK